VGDGAVGLGDGVSSGSVEAIDVGDVGATRVFNMC
jgi:hypothetical protein